MEVQIKTIMKYSLTPVREWSSTNLTTNVGDDVERNESLLTIGGDLNLYSLCGHEFEDFSQNIKYKLELPYNPAIMLLSIYPENSILYQRDS